MSNIVLEQTVWSKSVLRVESLLLVWLQGNLWYKGPLFSEKIWRENNYITCSDRIFRYIPPSQASHSSTDSHIHLQNFFKWNLHLVTVLCPYIATYWPEYPVVISFLSTPDNHYFKSGIVFSVRERKNA